MDANVLGPVEATVAGESYVPSAAKPRKLLVVLLAHANQVVAIDRLKAEIWGGDPPLTASTTLQTYVLQLRKTLDRALPRPGPDAKAVLVTRPGGYQFRIDPARVDLYRFEALARRGMEAMADGRIEPAARYLREALDLWRGPAFADVVAGPVLRARAVRLHETRLHVLERHFDVELRLGNHQAVLGEIAMAAVQEPLNEDIHARLMLAMYRSGRRAEALEAFRDLRARLVEETGLEPSPTLYRLQRDILTDALV